jgi:hypothetical protein
MAYLYNNIRVKEFRDQRNKVTQTHEELEELKSRIDRWNQVLHRKDNNVNEAESGLLIDMDDCVLKLKQLKKKQKLIHEHPEKALRYAKMVERLFIWFHDHINNVVFMHEKELDKVAEALKNGAHTLPNPVMDHYIKIYIESKEKRIKVEELKLATLKLKNPERARNEVLPILERKVEQTEDDHFTKNYTIIGLVLKILLMLWKFAFSSTQEICFLLMIIAQIYNGNILSLIYVLSFFCYGLVRRSRPHWIYWRLMKFYTGFVIIAKYSCVFIESVLEYNGTLDTIKQYQADVFYFLRSSVGGV